MADEDEDYFLPVEDQRVFGAGIRRKGIAFVPASNPDSSLPVAKPPKSANIASRYLSIVLPESKKEGEEQGDAHLERPLDTEVCAICKQPIGTMNGQVAVDAHESSIAHQVCLEHSHPPSHLDREHMGLKYLETYGWDPDSRKGLGARQEGIRIPIKPKEKKDTTGLREADDDTRSTKKRARTAQKDDKVIKLNAKQVRVRDLEAKKKAEKLRRTLYGPDLENYLGPNS